jgi:hypothetical protein
MIKININPEKKIQTIRDNDNYFVNVLIISHCTYFYSTRSLSRHETFLTIFMAIIFTEANKNNYIFDNVLDCEF